MSLGLTGKFEEVTMKDTNRTMAGARFTSSVKTGGAELPDCFAAATVASVAKCTYKRRIADQADQQRLERKARKLGWVKELLIAQSEAHDFYTELELADHANHGPVRS